MLPRTLLFALSILAASVAACGPNTSCPTRFAQDPRFDLSGEPLYPVLTEASGEGRAVVVFGTPIEEPPFGEELRIVVGPSADRGAATANVRRVVPAADAEADDRPPVVVTLLGHGLRACVVKGAERVAVSRQGGWFEGLLARPRPGCTGTSAVIGAHPGLRLARMGRATGARSTEEVRTNPFGASRVVVDRATERVRITCEGEIDHRYDRGRIEAETLVLGEDGRAYVAVTDRGPRGVGGPFLVQVR